VRSRVTAKGAILDALGRLQREKVLGVVLNDHQEYRHSYSAYAYRSYGMAYGSRRSTSGGRSR
jgi:hypothetical protein